MINYSIILFGYMGVGKSYIGKKLSEELIIDFFDLDNYIEFHEKKSINNIFYEKGEVYFRSIENKYLESILNKKFKYIISTGGGTPCYSNNIELIKKNKYLKSFTVYVHDAQLYRKNIADEIEKEFKNLKSKNITKINKFNSDPKSNPQPPKKYF